ncbi:MAG: hypothetical protein OHK0039_45350 [Bacteroidia bacterium]
MHRRLKLPDAQKFANNRFPGFVLLLYCSRCRNKPQQRRPCLLHRRTDPLCARGSARGQASSFARRPLRKTAATHHPQSSPQTQYVHRDFYLFRNRWLDPLRFWQDIEQAPTPESYEQYLAYFPEGPHREEALWGCACLRPSAAAFDAYLAAFSEGGRYTDQALENRSWYQAQETPDTFEPWIAYLRRYRHAEDSPVYERVIQALEKLTNLARSGNLSTTERNRFRGQIADLEESLTRERLDRQQLQTAHDVLASDKQSLEAKLNDFAASLETLQQALAQSRNELGIAQQQVEDEQRSRQQLQAAHDALQRELVASRNELGAAQQTRAKVHVLEQKAQRLEEALAQARLGSEAYERAARQVWEELFAHTSSLDELDRYLRGFPKGDYAA